MRLLIICATLLLPITGFTANQDTPSIVEKGLIAYKNGGAKEALKAWVKGSGLENSKAALSQANTLLQIEDYYGPFMSYEIVHSHNISKKSKMILFVINYKNGISYGRFQAYNSDANGWVATEFKFHTEAALVWPNKYVFGE